MQSLGLTNFGKYILLKQKEQLMSPCVSNIVILPGKWIQDLIILKESKKCLFNFTIIL